MSPLTIEQVLEEAATQGVQLSERTFRYYAALGLLPPTERPPEHGDGRCQYYPPTTVEKLMTIRRLQAEGYSLKQIKDALSVQPAVPAKPGPHAKETVQFLKALAGLALAEDVRQIRNAADEPAFRQAVLDYYRHLLEAAFGKIEFDAVLAQLTPLDLQGLLRPFRGLSSSPRAGTPPWLAALGDPQANPKAFLQHLHEVQERLKQHHHHKIAQQILQGVTAGQQLWEQRSRGENVSPDEIEELAARLRACLSLLKSAHTLQLPIA
ncbi:MAG: MerR family transcriptional regulator [Candidatus Xenobia bacterium]